MCSNPCESELTCFRPESNRGPYGWLNFLSAALSTNDGWITENPLWPSLNFPQSPGSGRTGVIGVGSFCFPHLRPFKINFTLPGRPSSAIRHYDVVQYSDSEVADSVHARTCSLEQGDGWHGRFTLLPPDEPYSDFGLSIRVSMFRHVDWWLGPLPGSPGMGEGGDW